MPRPPDIDDFGKLNFIANYFLHGCTPPMFLFLQCANEPIHDLSMLLLFPDFVDIGQAIFDPKGGRRRKPGRHGRKSGRGPGFPDTSDMVGQKARGILNPHNALNFGPVNKVFRIVNVLERVAFTAAILEGVTDIGYEGLLGVLTVDPNHCKEFSRLVRRAGSSGQQGGAGQPINPINLPIVDAAVGFGSWMTGCNLLYSSFVIHLRVVITPENFGAPITVEAALGVIGQGIREHSSRRTIQAGDVATLECSATFVPGENCEWGIGYRIGFYRIIEAEIVAFAKADIPWPW